MEKYDNRSPFERRRRREDAEDGEVFSSTFERHRRREDAEDGEVFSSTDDEESEAMTGVDDNLSDGVVIEGDYETLSEISSDEDELIRNGVDQTYDYYWNPNEGHSALQTILVDASFRRDGDLQTAEDKTLRETKANHNEQIENYSKNSLNLDAWYDRNNIILTESSRDADHFSGSFDELKPTGDANSVQEHGSFSERYLKPVPVTV